MDVDVCCVQVVELVEYSASQCPRMQANIVCGWAGRILDDLLETESSHPWIEPYVQGWLQSQLTEKLSSLLEKASDKVSVQCTCNYKLSKSGHTCQEEGVSISGEVSLLQTYTYMYNRSTEK